MDQNRTELEKKIVAAGSPEEIERILNDAGEKITAKQIMEADRDALLSCDVVVALLDGAHRVAALKAALQALRRGRGAGCGRRGRRRSRRR